MHQRVDLAELRHRRLGQPLGVGLDRHVGGHDQRPAAEFLDLGRDVLEPGRGPRGQHHVGAGGRAADRDLAAEVRADAGDDEHLVLQVHQPSSLCKPSSLPLAHHPVRDGGLPRGDPRPVLGRP